MNKTANYNNPCIKCSSSDGMTIYTEDGKDNAFCYSCGTYFNSEELNGVSVATKIKTNSLQLPLLQRLEEVKKLEPEAIKERGISRTVAQEFGVRTEHNPTDGSIRSYWFPYRNSDGGTWWKVLDYERPGGKKIIYSVCEGDASTSKTGLFGGDRMGKGGKMVIVTEGEFDTLAVKQLLSLKNKDYRVVSIPHGSNSINKLGPAIEELESFESVMICFDQDEPGRKAAHQLQKLLSPGKGYDVILPSKDANELLLEKQAAPSIFYKALGNAKPLVLDGIVSGRDTWERLMNRPTVVSVPYPESWTQLNRMTYGVRLGDLDIWTSGTGMGKTSIIREIQLHLLDNTEDSLGVIALEEPMEDSVEALMGLRLEKRINLPDVRPTITDEEYRAAWESTAGTNRLHFYDDFGSLEEHSLVSRIRYMNQALGCKYIFLDHLSMVVSEFAKEGGERERIDSIMSVLKKLTQELNIWIGLIIHLRKTTVGGKSFEEGAVPTLDDLRGSGSPKQLANAVYALSRNQQADSEAEKDHSQVHVLKCRLTGRTGKADWMKYDDDSGRMYPSDPPESEEDSSPF